MLEQQVTWYHTTTKAQLQSMKERYKKKYKEQYEKQMAETKEGYLFVINSLKLEVATLQTKFN